MGIIEIQFSSDSVSYLNFFFKKYKFINENLARSHDFFSVTDSCVCLFSDDNFKENICSEFVWRDFKDCCVE